MESKNYFWHLHVVLIRKGKDASDEEEMEVWVKAHSSRAAVIRGLTQIEMDDEDKIHYVHIGAPRPTVPKRLQTDETKIIE